MSFDTVCRAHGTSLYDETGLALLARSRVAAQALPLLPFNASAEMLGAQRRSGVIGSDAGTVVEVCGASGSGKTSCCLYAACITVLPSSLGGHGSGALILDCDGKLDARRFTALLRRQITRLLEETDASAATDAADVDAILRESMQRVFIARCWNTLQLLATTICINANFERMIVRCRHRLHPKRAYVCERVCVRQREREVLIDTRIVRG